MKKSMKKAFAAVFALIFALSVPFVSMAAPAVNVTVFDKPVVWTDAEPFIDENNRTLVPLRAVGEDLGLTVNWDEEAREAVFSSEYTTEDGYYTEYTELRFPIGSQEAKAAFRVEYSDGYLNEWEDVVYMDTTAVIVNDRTYAPARYLAEFFGYEVRWLEDTRTVAIDYPESVFDYDLLDWNVESAMEDEMCFVMVPGTDFDLVKDVKVTEVYVNDEPAEFYEMDKFETIPEGMELEDCYGICVKGDFSDTDDLGVVFDIVVNTTDYRTFEFSTLMSGFVFDSALDK